MPPWGRRYASGSRYSISYEDSGVVAARPDQVWDALEHPAILVGGSRWIERAELSTPRLVEGSIIEVRIATPLRLTLTVQLTVRQCLPAEQVSVGVEGDLLGEANLALGPIPGGTTATLWWALEMRHPAMRAMTAMSAPLLHWGHDMVARAAIDSFIARTQSGQRATHDPRGWS